MADKIATRQAYGEALIELVEKNDKVVVLDADLANATQTCKVAKAHPEKFYNCGIAEANMVDIAAGMSTTHVGALADEAEFQLDREGVKVLRTEGHDGKRWVLLDYGSVIVHVFTQEAHDYYDLEHLWADATVVPASEWMPEQPENEQ